MVARWLGGAFALLTLASLVAVAFRYPDFSSRTTVRFIIMGDFGTGTEKQHRVARAMKKYCDVQGCDFVLGLGDNFYDFGVRSTRDRLFQTRFETVYDVLGNLPFWMTLGNHDSYGRVQPQIDYTERSERWKMPARRYQVLGVPSWANLVAIDTTRMNRNHANWIEGRTCGVDGWNIIFGHHPIVSNGRHGDDQRRERVLLPVIKKCGIQAFFAGHDHNQEHIETPWFHQVVQGAAAKLRPISTRGPRRNGTVVQKFAESTLGFGWVELTERNMWVEFVNADAQRIYQFDLSRSPNG